MSSRQATTTPIATTTSATRPGSTDDAVTTGTDHFTYDSTWGTATGVSDLYDGTAHWSNTAGGTATFTFTGSGVAIHGVRDVDQGIATYSVDGGTAKSVDDYSPTRNPDATLFAVAGLTNASHTITITITGTKNSASSNDIVAVDSATIG